MENKEKTLTSLETELLKKLESKGHAEELVDHYWGSINYVLGLIRASEVKAGLILTFYGILLNFIFQQIEVVLTGGPKEILLYILLILWFLSTVISIYFSIRCFMPRLEGNYEKNVFYFGDVITKFGSIKEFSKIFYTTSLKEEELFDQLGQQIYIISKIATAKFKYVNRSLQFLASGLIVFLILVVYYAVLTLGV
ncbi:Pycsar system effector family protein [Maribacter sp. MJ134]|uniref:Pycsar system effector family protein n=1 Tax=Maribacter sp. MJ134 TaxID=2496865 RepID=UPI001F49B428|nr:Pycsar system effector family protein [Maribacter sp. MJ134]